MEHLQDEKSALTAGSELTNVSVMNSSRRRLLQSLALAGGYGTAAEGAEPAITIEVLRSASAVHGTNLSDDRLRAVKAIAERRLPQLRALRDFEFDDSVAPTQGILDK